MVLTAFKQFLATAKQFGHEGVAKNAVFCEGFRE